MPENECDPEGDDRREDGDPVSLLLRQERWKCWRPSKYRPDDVWLGIRPCVDPDPDRHCAGRSRDEPDRPPGAPSLVLPLDHSTQPWNQDDEHQEQKSRRHASDCRVVVRGSPRGRNTICRQILRSVEDHVADHEYEADAPPEDADRERQQQK